MLSHLVKLHPEPSAPASLVPAPEVCLQQAEAHLTSLLAACRHFNVGWGSIESPAWHFLRVQAQFVNHLEVEILPVYRPSPAEAESPRLYADNVRHLMAARLGCHLCEEGIEAHMRIKRAGIMVDWTGRQVLAWLRLVLQILQAAFVQAESGRVSAAGCIVHCVQLCTQAGRGRAEYMQCNPALRGWPLRSSACPAADRLTMHSQMGGYYLPGRF